MVGHECFQKSYQADDLKWACFLYDRWSLGFVQGIHLRFLGRVMAITKEAF